MCFHDFKFAIEIDENGHSDRNIDCEIKREKVIEQELGCELIRTDLDKEGINFFKAINKIYRYIKKPSNRFTKTV